MEGCGVFAGGKGVLVGAGGRDTGGVVKIGGGMEVTVGTGTVEVGAEGMGVRGCVGKSGTEGLRAGVIRGPVIGG
jgi:hypothetical protein